MGRTAKDFTGADSLSAEHRKELSEGLGASAGMKRKDGESGGGGGESGEGGGESAKRTKGAEDGDAASKRHEERLENQAAQLWAMCARAQPTASRASALHHPCRCATCV